MVKEISKTDDNIGALVEGSKALGSKEALPYSVALPSKNYSIKVPEHYFTGKKLKEGEEVKYRKIEIIRDGKIVPEASENVPAYIVHNCEKAQKLRVRVEQKYPESNVALGLDHAHAVRIQFDGTTMPNGVSESLISCIQADMQMDVAASVGMRPYAVQEQNGTLERYKKAIKTGVLPSFNEYGMSERASDIKKLKDTFVENGLVGICISNHINGSGKHDEGTFAIHKGKETGFFAANVIEQIAERGAVVAIDNGPQAKEKPGLWSRWRFGVQNQAPDSVFLIEHGNGDNAKCSALLSSADGMAKQAKATVGGVLETCRKYAEGGLDVRLPNSPALKVLAQEAQQKMVEQAVAAQKPVFPLGGEANFSLYNSVTNTPRGSQITKSGFPIAGDGKSEVARMFPHLCCSDGLQPTVAVAASSPDQKPGSIIVSKFVRVSDKKEMPLLAIILDDGTLTKSRAFDANPAFAKAVTQGELDFKSPASKHDWGSLIYPKNGLKNKSVPSLDVVTQNTVIGRLPFGYGKDGEFRVGDGSGKITPEIIKTAEVAQVINLYNAGLITRTHMCSVIKLDATVLDAANVPEQLERNEYYIKQMKVVAEKYAYQSTSGLLTRVDSAKDKHKYPESARMLDIVTNLDEFYKSEPNQEQIAALDIQSFIGRGAVDRQQLIASAIEQGAELEDKNATRLAASLERAANIGVDREAALAPKDSTALQKMPMTTQLTASLPNMELPASTQSLASAPLRPKFDPTALQRDAREVGEAAGQYAARREALASPEAQKILALQQENIGPDGKYIDHVALQREAELRKEEAKLRKERDKGIDALVAQAKLPLGNPPLVAVSAPADSGKMTLPDSMKPSPATALPMIAEAKPQEREVVPLETEVKKALPPSPDKETLVLVKQILSADGIVITKKNAEKIYPTRTKQLKAGLEGVGLDAGDENLAKLDEKALGALRELQSSYKQYVLGEKLNEVGKSGFLVDCRAGDMTREALANMLKAGVTVDMLENNPEAAKAVQVAAGIIKDKGNAIVASADNDAKKAPLASNPEIASKAPQKS